MNIGAAILMGGENKRMEGQIKGLLKIDEVTFLNKIHNILDNYENIYLSINKKFTYEEIKKYEEDKLWVIVDVYENIGPIGGIYSSLKYCQEDYLFITACDMPFINKKLINLLNSNLKKDTDIIVFSKKGIFYPLGAIYSKKVLPIIETMIKNKEYKLSKLIEKSNFIEIPVEKVDLSEDSFININTIQEYEEIIKYK